jgi:hypothetical protein
VADVWMRCASSSSLSSSLQAGPATQRTAPAVERLYIGRRVTAHVVQLSLTMAPRLKAYLTELLLQIFHDNPKVGSQAPPVCPLRPNQPHRTVCRAIIALERAALRLAGWLAGWLN